MCVCVCEGLAGEVTQIRESKPDYFTTSTWYRVWQIMAPDNYFLSQCLAGAVTLLLLRFGRKRERLKAPKVFPTALAYGTLCTALGNTPKCQPSSTPAGEEREEELNMRKVYSGSWF